MTQPFAILYSPMGRAMRWRGALNTAVSLALLPGNLERSHWPFLVLNVLTLLLEAYNWRMWIRMGK